MKSNIAHLSRTASALLLGSLLASSGLFAQSQSQTTEHPDAVATARLQPAADSKVTGVVHFIPAEKGLRVVAHVVNLTPGDHGFHVHEKGDLSAPDLTSAGGHFNPTGQPHGAPDSDRRHVGDLGNLKANERGVATLDFVDRHLTLDGKNSIVGKAVIVHEKADDLKSQPTGDAGGRVAGGVIERVTPKATKAKAK